MNFKPIPELSALGDKTNKQTALQRCLSAFVYSKDEEERFAGLKTSIFLSSPEFVETARIDPETGAAEFTPTNKWNPWLERNLRAFVNEKYSVRKGDSIFRGIALTGCGGAGKTHAAGLYAVKWWMPRMQDSIAILTSTTKDMIRNRIWPVIHHYWSTSFDLVTGQKIEFGHMVDSQMKLMAQRGNAKNSISAYAVAHGETQKAIHNLKGMHAPRMLLIIDEANGTPEAIFKIIANYRKACQDLTVIIIGNPCSRLDPHGLALTPENGWSSVNDETIEWRTAGVPDWQFDGGVALRFDGRDSPNVKLKRNKHPYIYTLDDWNNAHSNPNYVGTLNYWVMERGLHPPEGTSMTVFSEQLFMRCLAKEENEDEHFIFDGEVTMLAFLDPAFTSGGDKAFFQPGVMGRIGDRMCIQLLEGFEFPISPDLEAYDIDYQLAIRFMNECITRKIRPECSGVDGTGGGRGVVSHLAGSWSPAVNFQNWGGSASDRACAQHDGSPARDVYANKVSELWFNVRDALEAGQIKGFSRTAMGQACSRMYSMQGRKIKIEPKDEMKTRVRYSPDEFDAIAGLVSVAMDNGFLIHGKVAKIANTAWQKQLKDVQEESALVQHEDVVAGGWAVADYEGVNW